jgi:hypothetical protein
VDQFLKTALARTRETLALFARAKGNSTSSYSSIAFGSDECTFLEGILVQLSESPGKISLDGFLAEIGPGLHIYKRGSRLEKVIEELCQAQSDKSLNATASSGGEITAS